MHIRTVRLAFLVALACLVCAAPAAASFRGKDGDVAFAFQGNIVRIHNGHIKSGTRFDGDEASPSISRNGRMLAFEFTTPTTTSEIFTSTLTGHHARWITKSASRSGKWLSFHDPAWAPNGKRLVFVCNAFEGNELCTVGKKGGHVKKITHCTCVNDGSLPDWTRHDRIYFGTSQEIDWVSAHGGPVHQVYHDPYFAGEPSVSPNGQQVAFRAGPDANTRVDIINSDGSGHRVLLTSNDFGTDPTDYDYPAWAPDGKFILVHVSGLGPQFGGKPEGFYLVEPSGANLRPVLLDKIGQYPETDWGPKARKKKKHHHHH